MNAQSSTAGSKTVKYFFPAGKPIKRLHIEGQTLFVYGDQEIVLQEGRTPGDNWISLADGNGVRYCDVRAGNIQGLNQFEVKVKSR